MAYSAPTVTETGLHIPTFQDILDDLVSQAQALFGPGIYLGNDSSDYQILAVFARNIYDAMMTGQLIYNNRSPVTAIGLGLDTIIKMNGLKRKASSYSTCVVTLTGTAGTVISNGVVQDINGVKWDLPASVTIGDGGTVTVTATCETIGAVGALAGELTTIATPTAGWISVTNGAAAVLGASVETDSILRARQAVSVAGPSQTELAGTKAAIASIPEVTRWLVLENDSGSPATDPNGLSLPGHSITCVVEGATDAEVAQAIYKNRGIGCWTNGTTTIKITDPIYLADTNISFYRPTYVPIHVAIEVHPLYGYTSATKDDIKASLTAYLNGLQIFETVTLSGMYGAALSVLPNLAQPTFSIRSLLIGTDPDALGTNDIALLFYQVAQGLSANVDYTEV